VRALIEAAGSCQGVSRLLRDNRIRILLIDNHGTRQGAVAADGKQGGLCVDRAAVQAGDGVAAETGYQPTTKELTLVVRELDLQSPQARGIGVKCPSRSHIKTPSQRHVWTVHL
jgi:hypothetical protein